MVHARWHTERHVLASMPHADVAHLPLEIAESGDGVAIPACFRCAATTLIIDNALDNALACGEPRQLTLFN